AFNLSHDQTLQFNTAWVLRKPQTWLSNRILLKRDKTLEFTSVTCVADNLAITSLTSQAPTRIA
ncbi:hypothetical protein, partial [Pseudomonas aeruginosa]|uniref:hypothetical protein n=1 Tax=Pseudomonas aeruginosa TaxID=287 RepID=UPI001EE0A9C5